MTEEEETDAILKLELEKQMKAAQRAVQQIALRVWALGREMNIAQPLLIAALRYVAAGVSKMHEEGDIVGHELSLIAEQHLEAMFVTFKGNGEAMDRAIADKTWPPMKGNN